MSAAVLIMQTFNSLHLNFQNPYIGLRGKQRIAGIKRDTKKPTPGVYIIKQYGVIVYVGYSRTDVWKVLYRHFQQWTDIRWLAYGIWERKAIYPGDKDRWGDYEVAIYPTDTSGIAEILERTLICELNPRDNSQKYWAYTMPEEEESRYPIPEEDILEDVFGITDEGYPF